MARLLPPLVGVVLVLSSCFGGDDDDGQDLAVSITPAEVAPGGELQLTFPTPYVIGDKTRAGYRAGAYDNYHVVVDGPSGPQCRRRDRPAFGLGYPTKRRRTSTRTVTIRAPSCLGDYSGTVAYYLPERRVGDDAEQLGSFSFTVQE